MKTFKLLHAPLHGSSATNAELQKALNRRGVVGVAFSEAYDHGHYLRNRPAWRAVVGSNMEDARGRKVQRDVILAVRKYRKHLEHGIRRACDPSTPLKIAPARFLVWTVDNVHGRPLAMVGLHPNAAVKRAWGSDRAEKYRHSMRELERLVNELRARYGDDLDIVVLGDLNYPNVEDGRYWAPRQVFARLGLNYLCRGIDWVASSGGLRRVRTTIIPTSANGQDHPWIEVEFARR